MLAFIMTIDIEKDRELATELYKQYSSTMLYIANSILHDIYLAEDDASDERKGNLYSPTYLPQGFVETSM